MYSPTLLSWNENLSTGDRELDTQHKYLFEICNDLATAIEKKRGPTIVGMVLDILTFYAKSHFKKEEDCMERYRCIVAHKNQKAHSTFLQRLEVFQSEFTSAEDPETLAANIHQFLIDWIQSHIVHVDTQLRTAIHTASKPGDAAQAPIA